MRPLRSVDLETAAWVDASTELAKRGVTLLVGSGVSDWRRTDLPTGQAMTAALAELLTDGVPCRSVIMSLVSDTAFEHVMEACPRQDVLGRRLRLLYSRSVVSNPIHDAIAALVQQGIVRNLITTNYDACLEAALNGLGIRHQVVITADQPRDRSLVCVFKIHGCAIADTTEEPPTMVYSLRREAILDKWKRDLLESLVSGQALVVCGYSGLDFEICPQLELLASDVFWNSRSFSRRQPRENARRVLEATNGTVLVGDIRALLGTLVYGQTAMVVATRENDKSRKHATVAELIADMRADFSEREIRLWQARLFGGIGCARALLEVGDRLSSAAVNETERVDGDWALGRGYFHGGKYFRAADHYRRAVKQAMKQGMKRRALEIQLDVAEADRCAGRYLRAWFRVIRVRRQATGELSFLRWKTALGILLISRHVFQGIEWFCRRTRSGRMVVWARNVSRRYLKEAAPGAASAGEWMDYQQCELWASRVGIPITEVCPQGLRPLPSLSGYLQLGYVVARSMAIRDALKKGKNDELAEDASSVQETLRDLGANAELWKLTKELGQPEIARRFFRDCEYTLLHRRLVWHLS